MTSMIQPSEPSLNLTHQNTELALAPNPSRLGIRGATPKDFIAIWAMLNEFQGRFLDDFQELTQQGILEELTKGKMLAITDKRYPIGILYVDKVKHNLHLTVHFMLRPQYFRQAIKENVFPRLIDKIFEISKVMKIKAEIEQHQSSAIKLMKQLRFKPSGILRNETLVNGKPEDMLLFELHHKFWCRGRKQGWIGNESWLDVKRKFKEMKK